MTGLYVMMAGLVIAVSIFGVLGLRGIRHEEELARKRGLKGPR
jgi:hypothetical protein